MHAPNVNDLLPRLQRWYISRCDGDWEHFSGVTITTLDNPGWSLDINLEGTGLEERPFARIDRGLDKTEPNADWFVCFVEGKEFKGRGGPEKLAEMIGAFLVWAEQSD